MYENIRVPPPSHPGVPALGHDQATKGKSGLICFISQFQFQNFFKPNFVCLLTNKRYKTYQTGFSFVTWVMPQGWDLGELGVKSVHLFVTLSPPKSLDEIQPNLGCELLT